MGKIVGTCLLALCLVGITAHLAVALDTFPVHKFPTFTTSKPILKPLNTPTTYLKSPGKALSQCSTPDPALTNVHINYVAASTYNYDADTPEDGVAVWHVRTTPAGNLIQIPDRIGGTVNSAVVISPPGPGLRAGWSLSCRRELLDSRLRGNDERYVFQS